MMQLLGLTFGLFAHTTYALVYTLHLRLRSVFVKTDWSAMFGTTFNLVTRFGLP